MRGMGMPALRVSRSTISKTSGSCSRETCWARCIIRAMRSENQ
jgi:hypothetical protein